MVLKILQWNLNGYLNNYNELTLLIKENKYDIIALQETHLHSNPPSNKIPKNFSIYTNNDIEPNSVAKRGVALLINNTLEHTVINTNTNILSISVKIKSNIHFTVISTYISPTDSLTEIDLQHLFPNLNTPFLLLGDLNAWSPLWGSPNFNKKGRIITNFIQNSNLILLNDKSPTHFSTKSTHTHIDLSICNPPLNIAAAWKIFDEPYGSDHYPISLSLFNHNTLPHTDNTKRYNLELADWSSYQTLIDYHFDNLTLNRNNSNQSTAILTRKIKLCANASIPTRTPNHHSRVTYWWNENLSSLRREKVYLWKTAKRNPTKENILEYKKANAKFKREAKISKRERFVEFTRDINHQTPSSTLWKKVNILHGNFPSNRIHVIQTSENSSASSNEEIGRFFVKTWSELSKNRTFSNEFVYKKNLYTNPVNTSYIADKTAMQLEVPFSPLELNACISTLKGKTPGLDNIPYPLIKNLPLIGKSKLCSLYNIIFTTSIIPQQWKTSLIIPISKPNKPKNTIEGYRPISLIPCLSKVMEKMIARRLMWFATTKKLFSNHQTAFKPGCGTIDALLALDEQISNSISCKNHFSILSLDMEKAFDRVGLHTIIEQLINWKVGPKIINYIRHYLQNRKICVKVGNKISEQWPIENGIPQGSPLSVVLFLIAFDRLSYLIKEHKFFNHVIYADDLYVFTTVRNIDNFLFQTNTLLQKISNWCNASGTIISANKSKHLHICYKQNCQDINICINNNNITNVNSLKILGLVFNNKYTWNDHITYLHNSLQSRLNVIKSLSNIKLESNSNTLVRIIKATILAKIDYGLPIFSLTSKRNLSKLSSIYHTAARLAIGAFRTTPIINILTEAGLPTLKGRIVYINTGMIFKLAYNEGSPVQAILKKRLKRKRNTRRTSTLQKLIELVKEEDISITPLPTLPLRAPPWTLEKNSIMLDLTKYKKETTPISVYLQSFLNIRNSHVNWRALYTDGSKNSNIIGCSVVDDTSTILSAVLPWYSSVFSAEATAILFACRYAAKHKHRYLICSDSLGAIQAILNANFADPTISQIRDILIEYTEKIKLLWVPGHIGIQGNTLADSAAKLATKSPVKLINTINKKDIKKLAYKNCLRNEITQWSEYTHYYKEINPTRQPTTLPTKITRRQQIIYTRFRLGHTRLTQQHLFQNVQPPLCYFCYDANLTIPHIIEGCLTLETIRQSMANPNIRELLSNVTHTNIKEFIRFITKLNIYFEV